MRRRGTVAALWSTVLVACGGDPSAPATAVPTPAPTPGPTAGPTVAPTPAPTPAPTTGPAGFQLRVVPALGGFSQGAETTVFDVVTRAVIGRAVTDGLGVATVFLPSQPSGPIAVVVQGGPGVTYIDERTGLLAPFGTGQSLISVVPNVSPTRSSVGVTPLTNIIANSLGITNNAISSAGLVLSPTLVLSTTVIAQRADAVLAAFGFFDGHAGCVRGSYRADRGRCGQEPGSDSDSRLGQRYLAGGHSGVHRSGDACER